MTKLNVLINKKTGEKDSKQQDTILMENDFIETLREHEAKSINMQVSCLLFFVLVTYLLLTCYLLVTYLLLTCCVYWHGSLEP